MNVYVAAAFSWAPKVRELHARLSALGLVPVSSWIEHANDPPEAVMAPGELELRIEENDRAVASADVVVVLASLEAKETFAEARFALSLGRLVIWVGEPRPLSAYRSGVVQLGHIETALCFLEGYTRADASLRRPTSRRLALVR
jgi:hypothetical protein